MNILIYNEMSGQMERMQRDCDENMPYTTDGVLTVEAFRGNSQSKTLWSTKQFLESVNESFHKLNVPFEVEHGFLRIWERPEDLQFAHQLGTALTGGQNLNSRRKVQLIKDLEAQDDYTWIQDFDHQPSIVHFHQTFDPISDVVVFQKVMRNSVGTSVCVLQDALWYLGYDILAINGIFDENTEHEVKQFQRASGLDEDGIVGLNTWIALLQIIDPEEIRYQR